MVKHLQMFLVFCLMLGGMLLAVPTIGSACSCVIPPPPDQALQQADAVFAGKVIRVEQDRQKLQKTILFEVAATWKGVEQSKVEVTTPLDSAACGFEFKAGQQYLVYANQGEANKLATNLCTRTAEWTSATEDLAVLGEGQKPKMEVNLEEKTEQSNVYAWILAVPVVGIVSFLVWRKSKR